VRGAAAGTISYTYDTANRLTAATGDTTTWTYDGAGNQTRNGITGSASAYNVRGAATANGAATYATHGQGNTDTRSRLVGTTTTRYLTSSLGLSGEEVGSGLRAFTRTPDGEALSNRLGGGSRYYYATDHQGSVIGMFSATGAWLGGYSYSPYGEERAIATGTAPTTNSLRYISGYWDSTAGLYRLGARYYDPTTTRFTQYDPSGQESNPYSYAACNPISNSDSSGTASSCGPAFGALLLGTVATASGIAAFATTPVTTAAGGFFGALSISVGVASFVVGAGQLSQCITGVP